MLVKILAENIDMELPVTLEEFFSHTTNTFSHGYHEYMLVWMPQIGEDSLFCRRELSNEKLLLIILKEKIVCKLQSYRYKNKQKDCYRIGDTN